MLAKTIRHPYSLKRVYYHAQLEERVSLVDKTKVDSLLLIPQPPLAVEDLNRAFSQDVTAAILVFQNNETAAMLMYQQNPLGVELFSHVNAFFCSNKLA